MKTCGRTAAVHLPVVVLSRYEELGDVSTPYIIASELYSMPRGRTATIRDVRGAYGGDIFMCVG